MKAIILAAGKGVRMLPFTHDIPKVLMPVNKKPFLWYVIQNLKKAGFQDIGIVVGYKKEKIKECLDKHNFTATLIEQKEPLGTGHAVQQAKKFCGNESCIVLGGDNLFSEKDLKEINKSDKWCYIVGKEEEHWQKYGVLVMDKNQNLVKIVEKPTTFGGNIINTGLYKFTPEIWPALEKIKVSERGEFELTDAISLLAQQGKVKVLRLKEYWLDLGCSEDVPKIQEFLLKKKIL